MNIFIKMLMNKLLVFWGIRLHAYLHICSCSCEITPSWINTDARINFHVFTTVQLPLPHCFLWTVCKLDLKKFTKGDDDTEDLPFAFLPRWIPLSWIGLGFFLKWEESIYHTNEMELELDEGRFFFCFSYIFVLGICGSVFASSVKKQQQKTRLK